MAGPLKKDLTPIGKGGVTKHAGKGSAAAGMNARGTLAKLQQPGGNTINNYAKASPMPGGSTPLAQPGGGAVPGLGSGSWPGAGM
jgi:hypothetical protein